MAESAVPGCRLALACTLVEAAILESLAMVDTSLVVRSLGRSSNLPYFADREEVAQERLGNRPQPANTFRALTSHGGVRNYNN